MLEITLPWPQILAELSPVMVAVALGWAIYRENQWAKDQ